jgi:AP-1 complex subunit beta-1
MSDSKYFQTTKKGEIHELKEELNSQREDKKKDAVKKVIAAMTVGKDVSMLFTDVLNCMQTHNLELKKLVYLYVMNYAKSQPDRAILAVNTFQKDASDPNPLIRALAVRTMGCIRVDKITEYLCEPLRQCLKDSDPYVRKTAAVCVAKLYDINPELVEGQGFLDILNDLLSDSNPMVVANAVAALSEIDEVSKTEVFRINTNNLNKLLAALNECTEWGQVFILNSLAKYSPRDPREAESIAERVTPRLQHANSAVVLSAVKVLMKYMDLITSQEVVKALCKKMAPPLVTLLSKEPEIQYVALRNINLIVQKRPEILQYEMKVFFCKYNDPIYVKMEKLEIMIMLAAERNIEQVLMEFKEYATEVDVEFVRKSVRAIGRCAIKLEKAAERCIQVLLDLIQTKVNYVVQEAIVVIKDIFRKYPNRYESIIATLCANLESLDEPEAKASMIWIIGEYAERIDNADELLASFLENFKDENTQVQLQLLTAVVKLFLKRPKDTQEMVQTVLNLATQESDNPDLRDRGFIYWRLLSTDPEAAKSVVLAEKPLIADTTAHLDENLLNELIPHISTLASVYHKPPESFVTKLKGLSKGSRLRVKDDEEEESEYDTTEGDDSSGGSAPARAAAPTHPQQAKPAAGNLLDFDLGDLGSALPNPGVGGGISSLGTATGGAHDLGLFDLSMPGAGAAPVAAPVQKQVVLPADQGKGMQISAAFARREGRLLLDLAITNFTPSPMGNFVIQFDKNTFGIAPAGTAIPINILHQGQTGEASLPVAATAPAGGAPGSVIRMAVKNSLSNDIYFFQTNLPFYALFTESGQLERSAYLSMWKSIPDANERSKDMTLNAMGPMDLDYSIRKLTSKNLFEIARRKVNDQDVVYLSAKTENSVYILVELTFKYGVRQCKCSCKTASVEYAALFEQAIESILNSN